jgi:multicomponent K+:H+ antiporter subunit F
LLNLWQILKAEGVGDRVLALDTMVINVIALIVLFGMRFKTEMVFESALLISMLGFVSTVAYTRFMLRGNIIE